MGKDLASIIAASRAVMEKSDTITNSGKELKEEKDINYVQTPPAASPAAIPKHVYEEKLAKSKLPDSIKAIMEDTSYGMNVDMGVDLSGAIIDQPPQPAQRQRRVVTEVKQPVNGNLVGLTENEVRAIVNDELTNFLATYFTKTLTENVQKDLLLELKKRQLRLKKKKK
jgi:hypothetical protein